MVRGDLTKSVLDIYLGMGIAILIAILIGGSVTIFVGLSSGLPVMVVVGIIVFIVLRRKFK